MACKPSLPPDLRAKRCDDQILRRCNDQILNQKEDIKSENEKQNDCGKVQDIFKHNNLKNIKVTSNTWPRRY